MLPIRYLLSLLFVCLMACVHQIKAQCIADYVVTNVTCFGSSDGSIDLSAFDGTAPYTYAWSNNETSEDLANLAAGTYTCTITDALGCIASAEAIVAEPDALIVTTTGGVLTCQINSLTIQTVVTGGIVPYAYLWSNGATVQQPVANIPGTYVVTVTDAQGCTATSQTVVTANQSVPGCSISPPGILTCINSTVTLNALCVPNGPQIGFQWTGPVGGIISGANSATVTVVQSGNYTLQVIDMTNSCITNFSMAVVQDYFQPIAVAGPDQTFDCITTSLQLNGTGSSTGSNYSYIWLGPAIVSGANTLNPTINQPGPYQLVVTNNVNGCTATDNMVASFLGTIPIVDAGPNLGLPCNGDPVTLVASASNGPTLTYIWEGPGIVSGNFNLLNPVVALPGTYSITVTDTQNGCTATSRTTVFPGPLIPAQQITSSNVTCFGGNNGSIDLSFDGGVPPYIYMWSNGVTIEDLSGLTAGTYTVTVDDASNCNHYAQITITQATQIQISLQKTNVTCNGSSTGSITLTVSGGTQPYTYLWSNAATTKNQGTLPAGTYTCTVTDAVGCTRTSSATITQPAPIVLSTTSVNIACNGAASGIIDLTITGGVTPYTYDWSNDGPDPIDNDPQDWQQLVAGTYTVTVTALNGCTNTTSVTLSQPTPFVLDATSIPPNCLSADGSINLSASGGIAPYNFVWSNGISAEDLNNLAAGTYTVTVVDANFCTRTLSVGLSNLGLDASAVTNPAICFGATDGSIDLSVTGAAAPTTYAWTGPNGYTSNLEDPSGLSAGNYTVSITSASGCVALGGPYTITQPLQLQAQITGAMQCFGLNDGEASISANGGTLPYAFLWSNGATDQQLFGLAPGTYGVTVTDANGCNTSADPLTLLEPPAISISFTPLYNNCVSAVVAAGVSGGTGVYQFEWSNGAQDSVAQFFLSNNYTLSVTDANGCTNTATYTATILSGDCSLLKGRVFQDTIENCVADAEPALSGWILRAEGTGGVFYGVSNSNGDYAIDVLSGDYTIFLTPPNPLWLPCWLSIPVGSVDANDTLGGFDFPVKKDFSCPMLTVDLSSSNFRRCFSNNLYWVKYCNEGTAATSNAYVQLHLDPFLTPLNSNFPYLNLGNQLLQFEVGDLEVGECGSFYLYVKVNCDAALGQSHCTEAHIYPDHSCLPNSPLWSGASLRINSVCNPDSLRFNIQNVGISDMPQALDYIVIEDQVMRMMGPVQLDAGQSVAVSVPANGSTWRLEMEQEPFHPGQSAPAVSVEGCTTGTTFSTGFVAQFPTDDADAFVDIDCKVNTASSDPNDKQAFPIGYGSSHYVRPGTPLEYQIRFQNTGNDTAFTVRVVDTLSAFLDPTSIRPGAGSHPYTWDLTGAGVLSFLFEDILLPDSNVNEAASHGFVKFTIEPRAEAPPESVIENTAHIYFDFNEAIVTNTTFHRLGEHFITVGAWQPVQPIYAVSVTPNPFVDAAILEVKGLKQNRPLRLQVFDLQGKLQTELESANAQFQLKKGNLTAGTYLFRIDQSGITVGSGKLLIQH